MVKWLRTLWVWVSAQNADPGSNPDLSEEDLREALRLNISELVKEVYEIAQRQMKFESERQGRLDSKASGLLAIVGLSLTVLFTFDGQFLFGHATKLRCESLALWRTALVSLVIAIVAGAIAAGYAVWALLVSRQYYGMNERTVFNIETLRKCDDDEDSTGGLTHYRRYLTVDMWRIVQRQFRNHERKARLVRLGQMSYCAFLVMLLVIGTVMIAFTLRSSAT